MSDKLKPSDWRIHCDSQRSVTWKGREFFANRCGRSGAGLTWAIDEMTAAVETGEAKLIDRPMSSVETRGLSSAVMELAEVDARPLLGHLWFTRYGFTGCHYCDVSRDPERPNDPCPGPKTPPAPPPAGWS